MRIYPTKTIIRDTARAFDIDDNDPEFIRDPTGLYAVYFGVEPPLLLIATEHEGHWDIVTRVWGIHFEKLQWLFTQAREAYLPPTKRNR